MHARLKSVVPEPARARTSSGAPTYTAGGEVGELYYVLESRLSPVTLVAPPLDRTLRERIIQAISRSAGWILPIGCVVAAGVYALF